MHFSIANIIFIVLLIITIVFFARRIGEIKRNILLGKDEDRSDRSSERWKLMTLVALGQSKMMVRPVAGLMHILIYLGFIIINIEIVEIILDGILGTHRLFAPILGDLYGWLINTFEILAVGVLVSCIVFLIRRNVLRLKRFWNKEMTSWPRSDANIILIVEILLMTAFLTMNAADTSAPDFVVSSMLKGFLPADEASLVFIERWCWWFHIVGVLAFLNYVPYSKHFHIFLAFPNVYYSKLVPKGQFDNMKAVTKQVEIMFDPNVDPYATPAEPEGEQEKFGAKDVRDLTWKQLMDSYSCTECGRCTSSCPANQTGKLLSPRKIMMDTRDRLEEVGKGISKDGDTFDDGKSLLNDFITPEELWACTSCNACTEACPVNIDPLSIIMDLRRYLVMEESAAPTELNTMFTNIENNGAPWQFAQADRMKWANEE